MSFRRRSMARPWASGPRNGHPCRPDDADAPSVAGRRPGCRGVHRADDRSFGGHEGLRVTIGLRPWRQELVRSSSRIGPILASRHGSCAGRHRLRRVTSCTRMRRFRRRPVPELPLIIECRFSSWLSQDRDAFGDSRFLGSLADVRIAGGGIKIGALRSETPTQSMK